MACENHASSFYTSLPRYAEFTDLSDTGHFTPLPDDWWVGTSDIKGSTQAVLDGKYKTVNMIGAAVISAQLNAHEHAPFPFVFGGDGASFAVPPGWRARSARALQDVRAWARAEFGMELRIAMVSVAEIRAAGREVLVARFQASAGVDYAMFAGGGLNWAEQHMKKGHNTLPDGPPGSLPDLTGLSCRWRHMRSRQGCILSVVLEPAEDVAPARFADVVARVLDQTGHLEANGHPAEREGPGVSWPPAGATLEAHAQRRDAPVRKARRKALFESFVAWVLIKTGLKVGGFDARRYRRVVGENADFRKFDDGLKMTLDCDPATEAQLRGVLEQGVADGILKFGLHRQSEAMMTCFVPSILADNHVHFVDGAAGGYTAAAMAMKSKGTETS